MIIRKYVGPSVTLPVLFVVLAGIPLATLGWLAWRLLAQDRALENQRLREQLENAATLLTREVDRSLATWEELLSSATRQSPAGTSVALPPNSVLLVFDSGGVLQHQGVRLPYYPLVASPAEAPASVFAAAEAQEFREEDLAKAAGSYRRLASTRDRRMRAAALMRLARSLRKQRQFRDALAVYGELAEMGETPVAGSPSELLARRERVALLKMIGDEEAGRLEAASLASALWEGGLRIDRATFDFFRESTPLPPTANQAVALAEAVEGLWPLWQQEAAGRAAWTGDEHRFAAVWRPTSAGTAALVGGVDTMMASSLPVMRNLQVHLALEDPAGRLSWGALPTGGMRVTRTFRETGLPWTIEVAVTDPAGAQEVSTARRHLLSASFGLMILVIAAASYFVFRSVNRELSVARLQSDFVAAVSHEFRTPLTAMRHLTEMLEEGSAPGDRLPRYYRALGRETRRLQGMVESLLDFGRMEAGQRTYQMEDTSAAELATEVVDEFREHTSFAAQRIELHTPPGSLHDQLRIRADREAMAMALRNLLDNAVKYSPESSTVSVSVESQGGLTSISVEDHGAGVPKREQQEVFRKFVRGTAARILNVKGTGIGLAMADHIVRAHGGRLELASEPGRGSRFTILLPTVLDRAEARSLEPGA